MIDTNDVPVRPRSGVAGRTDERQLLAYVLKSGQVAVFPGNAATCG